MKAPRKFVWCAALALAFAEFSVANAAQTPSASLYEIVSEERRDSGAALAVRLQRRLSEVDLKGLADALRLKRPANKSRVETVAFFLPGSSLSSHAWAVARFDPDARVTIAGLRREDEDAYRAVAANDQRMVIGVWLTSPPALPGMLTIFRDRDRRIFAEWRLRSGQKTLDEVHQSIGSHGKRYDIAASGGGYYLALWDGALQLGDGNAVIAVAERLVFEKNPEQAAVDATSAKALGKASEPPAIGAAEPKSIRPAKRAAARVKAKREQSASDVLSAALRAN